MKFMPTPNPILVSADVAIATMRARQADLAELVEKLPERTPVLLVLNHTISHLDGTILQLGENPDVPQMLIDTFENFVSAQLTGAPSCEIASLEVWCCLGGQLVEAPATTDAESG